MSLVNELVLIAGGLVSGILAGLLGVGGASISFPLLIVLNYTPIQAIAISSLVVSIISISASIQNSLMGYFSFNRVIYLGLAALVTTQIGTYIASSIKPYFLLATFGVLELLLIYLMEFRKRLVLDGKNLLISKRLDPTSARVATGSLAGILAGFFGGGSGALLVPLQMMFLGESIKAAIQTSVGVNAITSTSAWVSYALRGDIFFSEGILLGIGGLLGAQIGTRFLPKLPDGVVRRAFCTLMVTLAGYVFWRAWRSYNGF